MASNNRLGGFGAALCDFFRAGFFHFDFFLYKALHGFSFKI
jgi:hypothetical protein